MKIAYLDNELKGIVRDHSVYGIECIINALVRASFNKNYISEDVLASMISDAWKRLEEEK